MADVSKQVSGDRDLERAGELARAIELLEDALAVADSGESDIRGIDWRSIDAFLERHRPSRATTVGEIFDDLIALGTLPPSARERLK